MKRSWFMAALLFAGCAGWQTSGVTPSIGISGLTAVVGQRLDLHASWNAECAEKDVFDLHNSAGRSEPCNFKPGTLEVSCRGPCRIEPIPGEPPSPAVKGVVALQEGPLTIDAVSTRADTGEVFVRTLDVNVVAPDALELDCDAPDGAWRPCDRAPLAAATPWLMPRILAGGHHVSSTLLLINGQRLDLKTDERVDLRRLYPDQASGAGVLPGTYAVELRLGDLARAYSIEAR